MLMCDVKLIISFVSFDFSLFFEWFYFVTLSFLTRLGLWWSKLQYSMVHISDGNSEHSCARVECIRYFVHIGIFEIILKKSGLSAGTRNVFCVTIYYKYQGLSCNIPWKLGFKPKIAYSQSKVLKYFLHFF